MKWILIIMFLSISINIYAKESKMVTKYFNSVYITESDDCYYTNTKGRTFTKLSLDDAKKIVPQFFELNNSKDKFDFSVNLTAFPNPCYNNLSVNIKSENEAQAKIYLMDENNNCELIFQGTMNIGNNDLQFDLSKANKGLQIICFEINGKKYYQKIIKM